VRSPGSELQALLESAVPTDHARQTLADRYIEAGLGQVDGQPWRVLDLGCGSGSSVDLFRARDPGVHWIGLDVPSSREAHLRLRTDARFETFDGTAIPFGPGRFDLVYCKQVLEHVGNPEPLLAEVRRVLAPNGYFAGSTSQLEPFHSMSMWNYTPVGFASLLCECDLHLVELRPGIDAFTLITRRLVGQGRVFNRLWARWWGGQAPLNRAIDVYGRARGFDVRTINATKLLFSGQFAFVAQRLAPVAPRDEPAEVKLHDDGSHDVIDPR
jgi:SAM-dependent methyltransferase